MTNQNPNVDKALIHACNLLELEYEGQCRYGWNKKSAGCLVKENEGGYAWLRVQFATIGKMNKRIWEGELSASNISGVSKPFVKNHVDWEKDNINWRAIVMSYVNDSPCSDTPELQGKLPELSDLWFLSLRDSLESLRRHPTERINSRQDLITRRISEYFGNNIDTKIKHWCTCHGDLHWANLTCPKMYMLDWEAWGLGPLGLDPALLLAFSVIHQDLYERIFSLFNDWLETPDGRLSILFVCAELLRMIELYGDHPTLKPGLQRLASSALNMKV